MKTKTFANRKNNFLKYVKMPYFMAFLMIFFSVDLLSFTSQIAGQWQTFDEKTKQPTSVISIQPQGSFYEGKIVKILEAKGVKKVDYCQSCIGERKNKPVLGLTIIQNMRCRETRCNGGMILDPRNGDLYHATMSLIRNGEYLRVRGYIFMPLFGKSVIWKRM